MATFNFLPSNKVKVFPCAYREHESAWEANLPTEFNITHTSGLGLGKNSYVIDNLLGVNVKLNCIIGGYYFELDFTDIAETEINNYRYAHIKLLNQTMTPGYASQILKALDSDTTGNILDTSKGFIGIGFASSDQSSETDKYITLDLKNASSLLAIKAEQIEGSTAGTNITKNFSTENLTQNGTLNVTSTSPKINLTNATIDINGASLNLTSASPDINLSNATISVTDINKVELIKGNDYIRLNKTGIDAKAATVAITSGTATKINLSANSATLTSPNVKIAGALNVTGDITLTGNITATGKTISAKDFKASNNVSASNATITGSLKAGSINTAGDLNATGNISTIGGTDASITVANNTLNQKIDIAAGKTINIGTTAASVNINIGPETARILANKDYLSMGNTSNSIIINNTTPSIDITGNTITLSSDSKIDLSAQTITLGSATAPTVEGNTISNLNKITASDNLSISAANNKSLTVGNIGCNNSINLNCKQFTLTGPTKTSEISDSNITFRAAGPFTVEATSLLTNQIESYSGDLTLISKVTSPSGTEYAQLTLKEDPSAHNFILISDDGAGKVEISSLTEKPESPMIKTLKLYARGSNSVAGDIGKVNIDANEVNVQGSTITLGNSESASSKLIFNGSNFKVTSGGYVLATQYTASGIVAAATVTATNVVATSVTAESYTANSDIRKKENIIDYIPEKSILDLPVKKFDFIDGKKNNIGCIAQDLQKICPEIVHEGEDGYLSIEESKLVYLLLDEVKKLKKEVEELKK